MNTIGRKIRLLRHQRGWSQEDVAARLGLSIPAFSKIETAMTDINLTRLEQIAGLFDLSIIQMLDEHGHQKFTGEIETMNRLLNEREAELIELQKKVIELFGVICAVSNIEQEKLVGSEYERVSGQLVQRNKDVEKFAFMVSHDLRAPLANMLGLAAMLKRRNVSESEKRELENFLFQSVYKLDEVVHNLNRILQVDKTQSLKKEKVDLTELVNEVSARFKPITKQDAIRMFTDFDDANEIFSVKSYLDSIFYNLISSSVIYNQTERPPVIEITTEKTQG